jgi:hypothetical protein
LVPQLPGQDCDDYHALAAPVMSVTQR